MKRLDCQDSEKDKKTDGLPGRSNLEEWHNAAAGHGGHLDL